MNKTDIINATAAQTSLKKTEAKAAIEAAINIIANAIIAGEKVTIGGFDSFKVIQKAARVGVSPNNHTRIEIPAKKSVKFKASSEIADKI